MNHFEACVALILKADCPSNNSQISRQSANEGGMVVSPTHPLPLPSRKYSWYLFLLEAQSNPGP